MDAQAAPVLLGSAAVIGIVHVALGPDHYLPFVAMSKARGWSRARTLWITLAAGVGHVLSSVIIGLVGLAFGVRVLKLQAFESARGDIAGWLLLVFGVMYAIWGLRKSARHHVHIHGNGARDGLTPWILFTILVFGPCEPLIPIIMYPAFTGQTFLLFSLLLVFSVATIVTMLLFVYGLERGLSIVPAASLQRYRHACAGFSVAVCGAAVVFLNL